MIERPLKLRHGSRLHVLNLLLRPPTITMIGMTTGGTVQPFGSFCLVPILTEHLELEETVLGRAFTVEVAFFVVLNRDRNLAAPFEAPQESLCFFKHTHNPRTSCIAFSALAHI